MFFHGSKKSELELSPFGKRYPFPYFFGTTNIALAQNFAHFHSRNPQNVVEFEVLKIEKKIDWQYKDSYTPAFRQLIFDAHAKHGALLIENVFDRPSPNYPIILSSIVAVFDLDLILFR